MKRLVHHDDILEHYLCGLAQEDQECNTVIRRVEELADVLEDGGFDLSTIDVRSAFDFYRDCLDDDAPTYYNNLSKGIVRAASNINAKIIWDVFEGREVEVPDEPEERKPSIVNDLQLHKSYSYSNGKLIYNGRVEKDRPYRKGRRYAIFLHSFPEAAWPYSTLLVADTQTGQVFTCELSHVYGSIKRDVAELLDYLENGGSIVG